MPIDLKEYLKKLNSRIIEADSVSNNRSWLEKALAGLDYLGNISRTAFESAADPEAHMATEVWQAVKNERYTSPQKLRDTLFGKFSIGKDDGEFDVGDVGDFLVNFGLDIATDPLTWFTGGVTSLGRKAIAREASEKLLTKGLTGTAKTEKLTEISKLYKEAGIARKDLAYYAIKAMKPAFGAMYGYAYSNPDDPAMQKLFNSAVGASLVYGGGKYFPEISKAIKKVTGGTVDAYTGYSRGVTGSKLLSVSDAFDMAGTIANKKLKWRYLLQEGYDEALEGLSDAEKLGANKLIRDLKKRSIDLRNKKAADAGLDLKKPWGDWKDAEKKMLAKITRGVNDAVKLDKNVLKPMFPNMSIEELDKVYKATDKWGAQNIFAIKELNKFRTEGTKLTGLKWHVDDVYAIRYFDDMEDTVQTILSDPIKYARGAYTPEGVLKDPLNPPLQYAFSDPKRYEEIKKIDFEYQNAVKKIADMDDFGEQVISKPTVFGMDKEEYIKEFLRLEKLTSDTTEKVMARRGRTLDQKTGYLMRGNMAKDARRLGYSEKDIELYKRMMKLRGANNKGELLKGVDAGLSHEATISGHKHPELVGDLFDELVEAVGKRGKKVDSKEEAIELIKQAANKKAYKIVDEIKLTPEALKKSHNEYLDRFTSSFLDSAEREAEGIIKKAMAISPENTAIQNWENILKNYDNLLNFSKVNMLGLTTTWLRTNYFDNMLKAYNETGVLGMLKTAALGLDKDLIKNINKISRGDVTIVKDMLKDTELTKLMDYGVFEGRLFDEMFSDETLKMFKVGYKPKFVEQIRTKPEMAVDAIKGVLKPIGWAAKKEMELLKNTTFKFGQVMEGTARYVTYKDSLNKLKKSGIADELVKAKVFTKEGAQEHLEKVAADITKRTFFDYNKVTKFEQSVMKRILPFWSFYSKNLPYWMSAAVDPAKIGRLSHLDKIRKNIGKEPTESQRRGMTDYVLEAAPRYIGKTKGGQTYATFPYASYYDAFNMLNLRTGSKQVMEKLSPYIKTPIEVLYNKDFFTGGKLLPDPKRPKYLFSKGYKWSVIEDLLNKAGLNTNLVKVDSKGNPISDNDNMVILDKLISTMMPMGLVDKPMSVYHKAQYGKDTLANQIISLLTPVQLPKVTAKQARWMKKQRRWKGK